MGKELSRFEGLLEIVVLEVMVEGVKASTHIRTAVVREF